MKPQMIVDYNANMGGVDRSDQLILYYGYAHRCKKWWKRVFFHLLDLVVVNSNILYNQVAEKLLNQLDFCLALISGLLDGHAKRTDRHHHAPELDLTLRLKERLFPNPSPQILCTEVDLSVRCVGQKRKKDHKQNINVKYVKPHYTYIPVLKFIILNYITISHTFTSTPYLYLIHICFTLYSSLFLYFCSIFPFFHFLRPLNPKINKY